MYFILGILSGRNFCESSTVSRDHHIRFIGLLQDFVTIGNRCQSEGGGDVDQCRLCDFNLWE